MNDEVTKGSNGQMNYTSGQGGGFWSYIDSLPLRYVGNRFYTGEYVADLEEENKTLKFQLQELNQANVNLFNEGEKLKNDTSFWKESFNHSIKLKLDAERFSHNLSLGNQQLEIKIKDLTEQLETKEIINQDLAKKYQILQEEIDAYDINMLELVEEHSKLENDYNDSIERFEMKSSTLNNLCKFTEDLQTKYEQLEQDYKELQKQSSECNLRFQIERLTKKLDSHKENFKKYEQHIYIGDKILDIINKVDAQSYNIILTIKDRLISSVELNEFNQYKYDKALEKIKQLEQDYNELSKNMVQGLKVTLQHRVKPYLGSGVVNVIIETKEEFK